MNIDTNKILLSSFVAFLVVLCVMAIITASYFARQRQILTNYAIDPAIDRLYGEYKKDQIIIKFKQTPQEALSVEDIKKVATGEARPVQQFLEMIGVAESPEGVPDSLITLDATFAIADVDQAFPLSNNQDVKGVSSDTTDERASNSLDSIYTISFESEVPVIQLVQELSRRPDIEYAEPNYIVKIQAIPNDPNFPIQWGFHNTGELGGKVDADIDAPEAWDNTASDSATVVVAVLDTGVDTGHEDLSSRIWRNAGETVFNGQDDDNNGFIDDVHGWNFLDNNYNISDSEGHGTHVSGIIAAERDNGKGIAGVAAQARIMPLKFLNGEGEGTLQNAARGIIYATDNGARVINCSFGVFSSFPPQTLYQAIDYARTAGVLVVTATGNEGVNIGQSENPIYPANYDLNNIISVASTTVSDTLSTFSNYSEIHADLAAPGSDILSASPDNRYRFKSGTSMAAPFVSGAVAVAMSHFPSTDYAQIRQYIFTTVDTVPSLENKVATGGRLNLNSLVSHTAIATPTPTSPIFITNTPTPSVVIPTGTVNCTWREIGDANCDFVLNLLDYVCWMQEFITGKPPVNCISGDFDSNGKVDILDYTIWLNIFVYGAAVG